MSTNLVNLPIATIQPDFQDVISDVQSGIVPFDDFWVSCYKTSVPSVHGKIHVELDEKNRDLVMLLPKDGDVDVKRNGNVYTVECPPLGLPPTDFLLQKQELVDPHRSNQHPRKIIAFDVSPDGTQFATGFHDGVVQISPATPPLANPQKRSKVHLSSVTSLRFFPSSRVLLTGGADFTLTILPADASSESSSTAPTPARILRGHTRAITSTAIVSRGRNVLSSSKDGTVRLWNVGGGEQIRALTAGEGRYIPVNSISIGERTGEIGFRKPDGEEIAAGVVQKDSREVETDNKVLWCALHDGSIEAFDLSSKCSVYRSSLGHGPLSSIAYSAEHNLLVTGSNNGVVDVFDPRSLQKPVVSFKRNGASIEDLAFTAFVVQGEERVGLVVATEDGLPFITGVKPDGLEVLAELVGGDCDGVRAVRVGSGGRGDIWTAGDDGVVRKY